MRISDWSSDVCSSDLALRHAATFPAPYRSMNDAEEAAEDILRLAALASPEARSVRVYRSPEGAPRLKIYRLGGPVELSDAVPVLENFGFRVIEEDRKGVVLGQSWSVRVDLGGGRFIK